MAPSQLRHQHRARLRPVVSTLVIFFALYLSAFEVPEWFINVEVTQTLDMINRASEKQKLATGTFGLVTWP